MNPVMSFKDYFSAMRGTENDAASLSRLLGPFKIHGLPSSEDEFLLVGHVLDALADEIQADQPLEASVIVELAMDLGMAVT
jgi:hypothetical protein